MGTCRIEKQTFCPRVIVDVQMLSVPQPAVTCVCHSVLQASMGSVLTPCRFSIDFEVQ